ncbi:thiamine ABC transporter substrate-binding protein [Salinirubrum litoreum]|uniref:Thiamine ABC transporter substrate binding subunit n=1 Tax=Salinirubrum litoreum TaxID=1126234 RepID=A0ABD5R5W8_9EURY|nr:thiamine ABC transporter substrate-binding protein [Salinirubrum litoreum]
MRRRAFLRRAGAGGATALLAGCVSRDAVPATEGGTDTGTGDGAGTDGATTGTTESGPTTLQVATYAPFVDAPSSSPGPWLKEQFESEFDATIEWQTPDTEINYFIERASRGVAVDADVYVGLDTDALIRVDEKLSEDLFVPAELSNAGNVKPGLQFDPQGRAIPFDTGYISLVYDENQAVAPETFDGLLAEEFAGDLITQNPQSSATGRAFLLHTIAAMGEDGYLDYWRRLVDNDVRILGSWSDAYAAYSEGEAPMVVSYSTDQVFANAEGQDLSKHQIRFLNDQGYANPEGMALFADADAPEVGRQFMDFMLRPAVQGEIAVRNVAFPATEDADVPADFAQYAKEPPEPVTFGYDELKGNVSEWVDAWSREVAQK